METFRARIHLCQRLGAKAARVVTALGCAAIGWSGTARAADVSTPQPGLTLAKTANDALIVADLCAAGVSVRATKYDERKATPTEWAKNPAVNAAAAVNADFFDFPGWTLVNGRARGAGADWPDGKMLFEKRGYWEFGPNRAGWQPADLVPPAAPVVTEIVGAHNVIIKGGTSQAPNFDGDSVILTAHRRTGIGLSKDRRHLYLFVSNASLTGTAMAAAMIARAADAGAPPIDHASNMDGGGSSQMHVDGVGAIFATGRQVNNHLGVLATGVGSAPQCPHPPPVGYLDAMSCDAGVGWTQAPEVPTQSIGGVLTFDGKPFEPSVTYAFFKAGVPRDDLCAALGSCNHGFIVPTPWSAMDGKNHDVYAYGFNPIDGGPNAELTGSPKTFGPCAAPTVMGRKRWLTSEDVLKAWKFSTDTDLLHVTDDVLATLPDDDEVSAGPELARFEDASGELVLLDRGTRRLVPSTLAAANWHFDATAAPLKSTAELEALPAGATLRSRPMLVQGSGPKVYLVDDSNVPPPLGTGGAGQGGAGQAGAGQGGAGQGGSAPPGNAGGITGANECGCTMRGLPVSSPGVTWLVGLGALALRKRASRRRLHQA